jgi:hypothetical protein
MAVRIRLRRRIPQGGRGLRRDSNPATTLTGPGPSRKMGHGGGGGRGLVGGWCPPPGPEKGRGSVSRGRAGPRSPGAQNKNRAEIHFSGPPARPGPPSCPPWVTWESPRPGPAPEPSPGPQHPAGPEIQALLPFPKTAKLAHLRPSRSERRASPGTVPQSHWTARDLLSRSVVDENG